MPRRGKQQPCQWKVKGAGKNNTWKYVWIPFQSLLDIAEFSLDHAIVKLGPTLFKQVSGIPMGDPLSPGMTIGTCCWMENKWMQEVKNKDKQTFRAKRYMDDILIWYIKAAAEQETSIIESLQASECYWPPLELEDAGKDTFLETRFMIKDNNLRTWLKNK